MSDYPAPPPVPSAVPSKISGMAIASLVLGILGLLTCGFTAFLGLIFGIIAIVKINNSKGELAGNGVALAGTIISALFMLLIPVAMVLPVLGAAKQRAMEIRSLNNEKLLALEIRLYASNHANHLPPAATWCDAIKPNTGRSIFQRPGASPESQCGYAFNAALDGMDISQVNPNTVMIFESDSGWNANGGQEIMRTVGYGNRVHSAVVAFADGSIRIVPQAELSGLHWSP